MHCPLLSPKCRVCSLRTWCKEGQLNHSNLRKTRVRDTARRRLTLISRGHLGCSTTVSSRPLQLARSYSNPVYWIKLLISSDHWRNLLATWSRSSTMRVEAVAIQDSRLLLASMNASNLFHHLKSRVHFITAWKPRIFSKRLNSNEVPRQMGSWVSIGNRPRSQIWDRRG